MRAHWKCTACLHEWQTTVTHKAHEKTGCPKCARTIAGRKADGTRQKHPTFAAVKHGLLEQWDHDRNSKNGNLPDNTTLRSHKLIWWRCRMCSKGKVHSWQVFPKNRTKGKLTRGCPCCVGQKLSECNSLEAVFLMLLLTLTLKKMVSVLLKSQVQQAQSIAGCQMSLEPKSVLWLNAHRIQYKEAMQNSC